MHQLFGNAGDSSGLALTHSQPVAVEIVDQIMEQAVPVHLGAKMHEHRAEPDRRPIHQHEFARRADAADALQFAMNLAGKLAPGGTVAKRLNGPHLSSRSGE